MGPYELIRELGRGGMGVVYEAIERPLNRRVALKLLPFSASTNRRLEERLHHEARIVARLDHPHIVKVYGSGQCDGVHYIAFQLIDGLSLNRLPPGEELARSTSPNTQSSGGSHWEWLARLGRDAADALQHAHENGIIHRDIKPSNLLVDRSGEVWVADFGLAQAGDFSQLTAAGDLLGTLQYMSPEQATGQRELVDRRTDIYSLGITLYERAVGNPAFVGSDRGDLLRQILFDAPQEIRSLAPEIPRDLATIITKAIAKLPSQRYSTASELAADLQRFLDRQPILAQPPTLWDWMRHFASRHRISLTIGLTLAFVLLIAWSIVSHQHSVELGQQVELLDVSQKKATKREWEALLAVAQRGRGTTIPGRRQGGLQALDRASRLLPQLTLEPDERRALRDEWIATLAIPLDLVPLPAYRFKGSVFTLTVDDRLQTCLRQREGSEIIDLFRLSRGVVAPDSSFAVGGVTPLYYQIAPGGRYAMTATSGALRLWDLKTNQLTGKFEIGMRFAFCWKADGQTLAVTLPLDDIRSAVWVLDVAQGKLLHQWTISSTGVACAWRPGHDQLALVSGQRFVLADAATGIQQNEHTLPTPMINVEWHSAGRLLLLHSSDQMLVWDTLLSREHTKGLASFETEVASPTGDLFATQSMTGETTLWNAVSGQRELEVPGRPIVFHRDGTRFATCQSYALLPWEIVTSDVLRTVAPPLHYGHDIGDLGFSRDSKWLAVTSDSGLTLVNLADETVLEHSEPGSRSSRFVDQGDGQVLISSHVTGQLQQREFDSSTGIVSGSRELFPAPSIPSPGFGYAEPSEDGRWWTISASPTELTVLDRLTGTPKTVGPKTGLRSGAISPDGRWVIADFFHGHGLQVWDLSQPVSSSRLLWDTGPHTDSAFSGDGRWLVVSSSGETRVWDVATWKVVLSRPRTDSSDIFIPIAFSPDSQIVALCENQLDLDLYETKTWQRIASLHSPEPVYGGLAQFSPDGKFLARAERSRVQIWNLEKLRGHLSKYGLDWSMADELKENR